jgi:hypothetical protein
MNRYVNLARKAGIRLRVPQPRREKDSFEFSSRSEGAKAVSISFAARPCLSETNGWTDMVVMIMKPRCYYRQTCRTKKSIPGDADGRRGPLSNLDGLHRIEDRE